MRYDVHLPAVAHRREGLQVKAKLLLKYCL